MSLRSQVLREQLTCRLWTHILPSALCTSRGFPIQSLWPDLVDACSDCRAVMPQGLMFNARAQGVKPPPTGLTTLEMGQNNNLFHPVGLLSIIPIGTLAVIQSDSNLGRSACRKHCIRTRKHGHYVLDLETKFLGPGVQHLGI